MLYLQQVLVILWTIWTHKNLVVHEGKPPNLMKVTQSLTCRYIEAYFDCSSPSHDNTNHVRLRNIPGKPWNLIIKVAGARMKRLNKSGFTFKAKNLQGNVILQGVSSYTGKTLPLIIQEAMLEVAMRAREFGCYNLLFLSDSFKVVQVTNKKWTPTWQDRSLLADWSHLELNNINCHSLHVSKSVISHVCSLAKLATRMPIHCCLINPTSCN